MNELEALGRVYFELLEQQQFEEHLLDYTVMEQTRPILDKMSQVNNSGVTVFDMFRKEHVYTSYNFADLFGYDMDAISEQGNAYFDAKVHPDDFMQLMRNGIDIMRFYFQLPPAERSQYKMVSEYRVLGKDDNYVRVIEQHQPLELDAKGNVWLTLGVIDISPDQEDFQSIKSQVFNYTTGQVVSAYTDTENVPSLSKREVEVLQFVKNGLLSKEISNKLSISVHTVNTHRQRILEKLGANNSMEATTFAAKLGLIK